MNRRILTVPAIFVTGYVLGAVFGIRVGALSIKMRIDEIFEGDDENLRLARENRLSRAGKVK